MVDEIKTHQLSAQQASKRLGISRSTLRRWEQKGHVKSIFSPGGRRLYNVPNTLSMCEMQRESQSRHHATTMPSETSTADESIHSPAKHYIYARVSSHKQQSDLQRQVENLQYSFPNHTTITDIASGINWQRRGLKTLLEHASKGMVKSITVAHRDRLCRFAFELLEHVFKLFGAEINVVHSCATTNQMQSEQQELAEDLMAINTVFICRQQERRAAISKRLKANQTQQETQIHHQTQPAQIKEKEVDGRGEDGESE